MFLMKLPNKIVSYKESMLYKLPIILGVLNKNRISISELYMKISWSLIILMNLLMH